MPTLQKLLFAPLALLLTCQVALATDEAWDIEIAYTGNLNGELEPCGCTAEGDLGGIARRATIVEEIRTANPNSFIISAGGLLGANEASEQIKNEFIIEGMKQINYDAIGVQWRDLIYGNAFLTNSKLPWVWSNRTDQLFPSSKLIEKGSHKVTFFSWYDPDKEKNYKALEAAIKQAKADGAITMLASGLRLKKATKRFSFEDIDILLIKARGEPYGEPQMVGKTLVLQPGSRGMYMAQLQLKLDSDNRIAKFDHKTNSIPSSVPDAPELTQWYANYNKAVKADFKHRAAIAKKRSTGTSPYTGITICSSCHQQQHEIWKQSEHAKAYENLIIADKAFDPACVICHTVGFNKEGGFIDHPLTPELADVQCESCHGAGREHAESKGEIATTNHNWKREEICAQCHYHEHSPSFNIDEYWKKIAHPIQKN
jgi:2',3'-cyclic-nucleotide 2'-phosphodiesterase (5'-nucleotidase family)